MSQHRAGIRWQRESADFSYDGFNRAHRWVFDGVEVAASSAPEYLGEADRVDPEQAFVAAIASCHMLTFLAIAAKKRLVVDAYADDAVGMLEKNAEGKLTVTQVVLRPRVRFGGTPPSSDSIDALHHRAHEHCFIANSVLTTVRIEPVHDA